MRETLTYLVISQLQLADSTSVRMAEAVKLMREKLAIAEKEITRLQTDNKKCKDDLGRAMVSIRLCSIRDPYIFQYCYSLRIYCHLVGREDRIRWFT